MPLQVFFSTGETMNRQKDFIKSINRGAYEFLWDFTYHRDTSTAEFVIAAACSIDDSGSEIYEFERAEAELMRGKGNPSALYCVPNRYLETTQGDFWEVVGPNEVVGKLVLFHNSHPSIPDL